MTNGRLGESLGMDQTFLSFFLPELGEKRAFFSAKGPQSPFEPQIAQK